VRRDNIITINFSQIQTVKLIIDLLKLNLLEFPRKKAASWGPLLSMASAAMQIRN